MATAPAESLVAEAQRELLEHILPFWRNHGVDAQHGGFVAELSHDLRPRPGAAKGLVLNARILWTFAAAWRYTGDPRDEAMARRAYAALMGPFLDARHGGFFWELDPTGRPLDTRKKVYGQAFGIYALAEFHRSFADAAALRLAQNVFDLVEMHAQDPVHGGYWEALDRSWQPCADVRLSEKDMNEKKSMNNHLHVLEAYAALLRQWPDSRLRTQLGQLLGLFRRRLLHPDGAHLHHFFDEAWTPRSDTYTYGHDIEASWLLCEAAEILNDPELTREIRRLGVHLARAVMSEGVDRDGGLFCEGRDGHVLDARKEWWPQAEAVVGFLNAWHWTGDDAFRKAAEECWHFIQKHIVDRTHGEWFWRVSREGVPDLSEPKVSAWKCPYHNVRCCLEILRRAKLGLPT